MTILMVWPARFEFNDQTAVNNYFQHDNPIPQIDVNQNALREFDHFANNLLRHGIDLIIVPDTDDPHTPDSIFPNNWISTHEDGRIVLYPMYAPNRRNERKPAVLDRIRSCFQVKSTLDYTFYEKRGLFLEGTGSMVLDRKNKVAYACLSPRTSIVAFELFCRDFGYKGILFEAYDQHQNPIYHTNVMMCIAHEYVVVNVDSVPEKYHHTLYENFEQTCKRVVPITFQQMNCFAGNMLQVPNFSNVPHLVMSSQAYFSLSTAQQALLSSYNPIVHSSLETIKQHGGGSARCMMAEIVLRHK